MEDSLMATKLTFTDSKLHTSQHIEVNHGQIRPVERILSIKTSTVKPKENDDGKS